MSDLVRLAVEWWRLKSALGETAPAPARHAVRRIEDFLHHREIEVQALDGRRYDPGLPIRVIDAIDDDHLPAGESVISETLSPLILWRGNVIQNADVVTRRGTMG